MAIAGLAQGIDFVANIARAELAKFLQDQHRPVGALIVNRSSYDFWIHSYEASHGTWKKHPSSAIYCAETITNYMMAEAQDKLGKDSLSQEDLESYVKTHYKFEGIQKLQRTAITDFSISGHARGAQGVVLLQSSQREMIDGVLQDRIFFGTHIALMIQRKLGSYLAGALIMDDGQLSQFGGGGLDNKADYVRRMIKNSPDALDWKKGADVEHDDQVLEERAVMEHGAFSEGSSTTATGLGFNVQFKAADEVSFEICDEVSDLG